MEIVSNIEPEGGGEEMIMIGVLFHLFKKRVKRETVVDFIQCRERTIGTGMHRGFYFFPSRQDS